MRRIAGLIIIALVAFATPTRAQDPTKNPCLQPIVIQRGPATASLRVFLGSDEVDFRTKVSNVMFKFHLHGSNEPHDYSSAPPSFGETGFANCVSMIVPLPDKIQRDGTTYDVYVQFENTSRMVSGWTADALPFALGGTIPPTPDPTPKPPRVPTARLGVTGG